MRAALLQGRVDVFAIVILLAWAVAGSIAAIKWFKWT
jgi:ABC-2 type transport system permease protein